MKLLGSSIFVTSAFFSMGVYLVHWTHSFLYLHNTSGLRAFQDGMFHKKTVEISDKMRIDRGISSVI